MEGTEYKFQQGDRVRLRPVVDASFYGGYACIGNEGVITQRRKDNNDLPMVFVEWDRNHWTYNNAPNCWTFEDHFDLVEATMPEKNNEDALAQFKAFQAWQEAQNKGPERSPDLTPKHPLDLFGAIEESDPVPEDNLDVEYVEALQSAFEVLKDCESFLVVGVSHKNHSQATGGMLMPFALGYSKTKEAEALTMAAATQY